MKIKRHTDMTNYHISGVAGYRIVIRKYDKDA